MAEQVAAAEAALLRVCVDSVNVKQKEGALSHAEHGIDHGMLATVLSVASPQDVFPWQQCLLARFQRGEIPTALDIPTGLGKTAVMGVWLVAQAYGAKLPRRLVYVVDRRAVVDQATDEALRLREVVEKDADLKEKLGLRSNQSLPISTLRGQFVDNKEWLDDPAAPAIVVGTVDMIGSRLLFEGYGVSRKVRPYHAGLLGVDSLIVLDEAHLVPPFEYLLRSIADPALRGNRGQPIPAFKVMALSATGRAQNNNAFTLTDEDLQHPEVQKRLNAKKALRIETLDEKTTLEDALAEHAWKIADEGKKSVRVLVYSDSREVAQKAKEAVEKRARGDKKQGKSQVQIETELLVGARRVFEREAAKERLKSLGFLAGSRVERRSPVFLFATSAGEVGVDLDADHMVCDLVAWERMVQRLGRVNRLGKGQAHIVVLVEPKPKANKKEEEVLKKRNEELTEKDRKRVEEYKMKVREWENRQKPIKHLPSIDAESYDASPGALRNLKTRAATNDALQKILDDATTPEPLRPALTRALVDAWSMTSLEKHTGRPAIQPWLRGWVEDPPQTSVVWRKYLPVRTAGPMPRRKEIEAFFEAAPPHLSEILETETWRVEEWIAARAQRVRQQKEQSTEELPLRDEDVVAFALDPDGGLRRYFKLAELRPQDKEQKEKFSKSLAGATLVLDARLGGLRDGLLDETADEKPRTADDGQDWIGEGVGGFRVRSVESSAVVPREANWRERFRFASAVTEDGEPMNWLIVEKWRQDAATEEDRSEGKPQRLDEHQSWAEKRARGLAKALDLDEALVELLALAARHHDEGKRATRWQRAFHAPNDGIYAKTEGPINYRLLDGYRHELGSLLRIAEDDQIKNLTEEDRDLVLHLIAAHHGFARSVIGTSGCEDAPPSVLEAKAAEMALRFARLQAHWGPWGLAWWEALLRAADQQASRDNDARGQQNQVILAGVGA